ncbi:MAG: SPOR domain-containing protein [Magnetococcales bacterium]|nr:SPOR domain-containing protein [Magnetococcales bacterium]
MIIFRILSLLFLMSSLAGCTLQPVVERLALFEPEAPHDKGMTSGTLAVLPLRGHPEQAMMLNRSFFDFFHRFVPGEQAGPWLEQPPLSEERLFDDETARQLAALGVEWVLTGRYQQPPRGFFTLEMIRVGDHDPFWMFGIPWTGEEQGSEIAGRALGRLEEKMTFQGRGVLFPVRSAEGFSLPQRPATPLAMPRVFPVVNESTTVKEMITISSVPDVAPRPQRAALATAVPEARKKEGEMIHSGNGEDSFPRTSVDEQGVDGRKERYVLQAGVFLKVENARTLYRELRRRGYEAEMAQVGGKEGMPVAWRVWIGLYDRYSEAREQARIFLTRESLPIHVALRTREVGLFRYAVQVAGFTARARARALATVLQSKGYEATVQESRDADDRVWHSVWIGRFWNLGPARRLAKSFRDREGRPVYLTPIDAHSSLRMVAEVEAAENGAQGKDGRYAVQVGSFTEEERARELADFLRAKGYRPSILSQTDGAGRQWRMVWIGRFHGFSKARRLRDSYRSREGRQAFVTSVQTL